VIANKAFRNVSKFRYLGATVINQNCIHEDKQIKIGECLLPFSSELLSSHIIIKNFKSKYTELLFYLSFCMGVKFSYTTVGDVRTGPPEENIQT
jgi:hypothetical protein